MVTPSGAVEEVRYGENDDPGHLLPGTRPQRVLPRVTTHEVKPRADQPPLKTTYTYTHFDEESSIELAHSFVGSNSDVSWRDDGEDNLYRAQSSYRYSVTAHYWKAGKVARKQTQTFNRYHLLTKQTLEEDGHIEETETVFHERPGNSFDDQPRYFQLPKTITKRWKLRGDASKLHQETATTAYDDYGNVTEEQAPTGGQSVYEEDDTGNSIRRRYDPLARLIEETVAPGQGVDEAKVIHTYGLVTHPEEGAAGLASQSVTGSTGVSTFITFDGCSRVVTEEREAGAADTAPGTENSRQRKVIAQRKYDELGQLSEETTFDYYDSKTLTLTSTFEYDAWSRLRKTTLPNGATQHSEYSPFGETGDIVTRWMETPDKPDVRQQQQVTESNRFDKLSSRYRLDDAGQTIGRHDLSYDGLGRCISDDHTFKRNGSPVRRINKYAYDAEGRVTRTERPDQSAVLSQFALHSAAPLAEQLLVERRKGVEPTLAWQRGYDGLDRLKSLKAGLQQETYTYTRHDGSTVTQSIALAWQEDDQLRTRTLTRDGQQLLVETFDYDALDRLEQHHCQGTTLPRNAAGRAIQNQFFVYDELNNLIECYTDFADNVSDEAFYTYDGFILKRVEHSLQPDYPASQVFEHDAEGNLLNDEQGNKLVYDDLGRLSEVQRANDGSPLYRYRYDGHNDLIGVRHDQAPEVSRRYQGYRVSSTRDTDLLTEYLYAGDRPLGLQRPAQTADNRLYATDAANSVVGECSRDELHDNAYTAYGDSPDNDQLVGLLGFNGEARERALGWSLLGRGYRAYNPGLMRFHSPDTAAPEDAGINPYVYCGGNPVNWHDPSGHYGMRHSTEAPYVPPKPLKVKADWRSWLGVALGAVFAVVSFILLPPVGLTMAFAFGAASLAIDVAATAVSVGALLTGSAAANDWAFWLGIASAVSTLGIIGYSRLGAKGASKTASVGTQTGRASSQSVPNVMPREGDVFFKTRIFKTAPKRLQFKRRIALPFTADTASQTTATGMGIDASTQTKRLTFSDVGTFTSPESSISSTASTVSNPSIGSYHLERLVDEPVTLITSPPAPPGKISAGSMMGYQLNPATGKWEPTYRSSYIPF
ncbi:TPA: hypothetical protein SMR48_003463 [Pseudomonas putida]|nr:hypothetical protein [Pseudomonas putida]